ncbi:HAD family hydrolase [Cellulomonas soli]|uniref:Haloacid dehalogenase n=1 Tax=Cellulomonas soli TaxID=931535 RepID=A0A512PH93_9CELL|nr:HAD family phosphatase [Cellulomonas soli]GEP70589.1 haloacid dehalogenase [Cellulomonas soli]
MTLGPHGVSAAQTAPRASALPAAVLWDMDGTLIDTEPFWIAAEIELVEAHGGVWTHEDGLALVGTPMSFSTATLRAAGVDLSVEEIGDFLNHRVGRGVAVGIPWQPGAHELLLRLRAAGVPLALVTSSFRVLAEPFARAVGLFDAVVAGDDVERQKPDPEPYLTAAALLGVDVRDCVVVEDSPSGIASAVASGAQVVAIEVMVPVAARTDVSRVTSLADLGLAEIARVAAGEVLDLRPAG